MADAIILVMTLGVIMYLFYEIWLHKSELLKRVTTAQNKWIERLLNNSIVKYFLIFIHIIAAIHFFLVVYRNNDKTAGILKVMIAIMAALFAVLVLFCTYFLICVVIKEIAAMKDRTIHIILLYSFISFILLISQVKAEHIIYPKGFVWINIILFLVNGVSTGKVIWIIFKKRMAVKSIWSITLINITFIMISFANIAYGLQEIYGNGCFSRSLHSWRDALYFVVITFFTVGYGDLYPTSAWGKLLSMCIIVTGFICSTIFVSAALSATIEHFGSRRFKKKIKK